MEQTGASAGGATALAREAAKSKKGIAANIELQETANQKAAAMQAGKMQQLERYGEGAAEQLRLKGAETSRTLQADKTQNLLSMAGSELTAANQAKAAAEAQRASGISGIIGGVTGGISSAVSAFGSEDFLSSGFGQLLTSK